MDFGWLSWLWIIPVLGLLIFVHELGHFVTARLNGIRVDEFGFGFPPRLIGIKRGGVVYSLNVIPVGGFVRIYGENGENVTEPNAFGAKAPWRRAIVLSAGSAMNILLAFLIFAILAMMGLPVERGAEIGTVVPGSPAAIAGMRPGDKVVSVAGVPTTTRNQVRTVVNDHRGQPTLIVLDRGGERVSITLTPRRKDQEPSGQGAMGVEIRPVEVVTERYNPIEAIGVGAKTTVTMIGGMVRGILDLISGKESVGGLAGPVGIAQFTSEVADRGQFSLLLQWTAVLSLNLFLVNMLPLPALDGGRLVFVLLEAIRGKKVPPQREAFVHAIGMMLLLSLMVIISFFDLQRIIGGGSFGP